MAVVKQVVRLQAVQHFGQDLHGRRLQSCRLGGGLLAPKQRVIAFRRDVLADSWGKICGQRDGEQNQAVGLVDVGAQDLEGIAQHHPAAGIHTGESLHGGLHLDHDSSRHLDLNLHLLKVRKLLGQLAGLFNGGEAEKIRVLLDIQRVDKLVRGVDAGVGGGGAVEVFDPE